jgi:hypothetical protein
LSISFLFDENPGLASAGSVGALLGGSGAVGSRWQPVLGGFWGRCFLTGQTSGQIFETPSGEPRQRLGAIKGPFGFEIGKIVKFAGLNSDQLDLILGKNLARLLRIEPKPSAPKTMDITQI